jgi:nucleoside-diphosphate-sugar epimerase
VRIVSLGWWRRNYHPGIPDEPILIIGGTRFVGYQLAWRLLAAGHWVTLLNRGTRPDPFGDRVERLTADRSTPEFARTLIGRTFDAAVDFAAYTGDDARGAIETLGQDRVGHYILISTGQVYLVRDRCPGARQLLRVPSRGAKRQ